MLVVALLATVVGIALGYTGAMLLARRALRTLSLSSMQSPRSLLAATEPPPLAQGPSAPRLLSEFFLDQMRVQAALQQAQVLSDNLVAAVVLRNVEGRVLYCSPYTEVLTGYGIQEILNAPGDFFEDVMHPDDREQYRRAIKICESGEAFQYKYRLFHRTGIEMWVETRTVPILNEDGIPASFLSITLDVTGAIRYQRQVEEKNRDLQDFTYMVSHDLKAPIFTIKGMLGVIRDDFAAQLSDEHREVLDHIERAALRLEQLVSRVLEYSRISSQQGKSEPADVRAVCEEVKKDFALQIKESSATVSIADDLPTVLGDSVQLNRVFANLIGNAIKYRSPDRAPEISVRACPSRDLRTVRISVSDNGQGIPADKLESVFRPFHRLHGAAIEGTGIGLATVKKLVERMGGTVDLESTLDKGSTFYVQFRKATNEPAH